MIAWGSPVSNLPFIVDIVDIHKAVVYKTKGQRDYLLVLQESVPIYPSAWMRIPFYQDVRVAHIFCSQTEKGHMALLERMLKIECYPFNKIQQ